MMIWVGYSSMWILDYAYFETLINPTVDTVHLNVGQMDKWSSEVLVINDYFFENSLSSIFYQVSEVMVWFENWRSSVLVWKLE